MEHNNLRYHLGPRPGILRAPFETSVTDLGEIQLTVGAIIRTKRQYDVVPMLSRLRQSRRPNPLLKTCYRQIP